MRVLQFVAMIVLAIVFALIGASDVETLVIQAMR